MEKRRSFFEKLTGSISINDEEEAKNDIRPEEPRREWIEEEGEEAQLTVDVYQTPEEIIIRTMVAGVQPEDLNISISRDMVTIKGKREEVRGVIKDDYFVKELYWGNFSRTVLLPEEVDPQEAEAIEKHGLLTIRLPKIDKERVQKIKVKSG